MLICATALALAIGWGIRGNFGHETGAMIPGALAALAAVILSRREDWLPRIGSFAFFGALGWSFGGSISYMQVIGYTHSGHSPSVAYGFACLFLIGFLWGAFGGVGAALPAVLSAAELKKLYPPVLTVFAAWLLQDLAVATFNNIDPQFRQRDPLYWYDTDWLGVLVALGAALIYSVVRKKFDFGASMITHLALGWWGGFLILVVLLGWRMTPPRGDNWAGCLGMFAGLLIFLLRRKQHALVYSALLAGTFGGLGFAGADLLKLAGIRTGLETNWHSVLEQSYGLINGIGIGVLMWALAKRLPVADSPTKTWTEPFAICFVLIGITWLNLSKSVGTWVKAQAMPETLYGVTAQAWFNLAYALLALLMVVAILRHRHRKMAAFEIPPLARATLFFLVFLWWIVAGNFERALVGFAPQRLITEGVIFLNAILVSALVLFAAQPLLPLTTESKYPLNRMAILPIAALILCTVVCWLGKRALYGDTFAGHAARHIRFGPDATAVKTKPAADKAHP